MASNTIIVNGKEYDAGSLNVENWTRGSGEIDYRFVNSRRTHLPVTEIVVHETVTCSALATVEVLEPVGPKNPGGRNLGVHFIVDPSGKVYQHGDLASDMLWHASQHNGPSFGIETVNPYEPALMPKNGPWTTVIEAPWAAGGKYVVPTPEEAEAVNGILAWAMKGGPGQPPELNIPFTWHGLTGGSMALGRVTGADQLSPGVYAHTYFQHADGAWLVLYCWLRTAGGMDPATAYSEAVKRCTGVTRADVSDLVDPSNESPEDPSPPAPPTNEPPSEIA